MKCISWNVNGIRACITKGFEDRFRELDADIFCLQETKCAPDPLKYPTLPSQRESPNTDFFPGGCLIAVLS